MEFMIGLQKHQEQHGAPPHRILSGDDQQQGSSMGSDNKEHVERIEKHQA
jgi:hypothetical protein